MQKLTESSPNSKIINNKIKTMVFILLIAGLIFILSGFSPALSRLLAAPALNAAESQELVKSLEPGTRLGAWSEIQQLPVPAITTVYSRVILGVNILTGLLVLVALLKIVLLIRDVIRGRRYFDPFAVHNTVPRLLNSSGAVLLLLLWWLLGEMLITNLQPVRYNRLGLAASLLAVSLLLSALFAPEDR